MPFLPRLAAMVLFVMLAVLVALLAVPVWHSRGAATAGGRPAAVSIEPSPPATAQATSARALLVSQYGTLAIAVLCLALTVTLLFSQVLFPPPATGEPRGPSHPTRVEIGALAMLAQSSVTQGEELSRERDVRRRAEDDARLKQHLLAQALDEKIRLGHDLHDGIIQSLYAAGLTLESIRGLVKSNPDEAEHRLDATRASLNAAIREVRGYIVGLAPENLRRAGFGHALNATLAEFGAGREARFDIQVTEDAAALLTPEQSIETLQIAREAVSNALRHGRATVVTLRLIRSDREVCLLVQDNGVGFDPNQSAGDGHGLGNMQARAGRLGATLKITSAHGEGVRVLATLPVLQPSIV